jgi:hypothetical protein
MDRRLLTTLLQREVGAASLASLADGRLVVAWQDGQVDLLPLPCVTP